MHSMRCVNSKPIKTSVDVSFAIPHKTAQTDVSQNPRSRKILHVTPRTPEQASHFVLVQC